MEMKLCQEFHCFPEPGGLRDQDPIKMILWVHMLNEEYKALQERGKGKKK